MDVMEQYQSGWRVGYEATGSPARQVFHEID